MGKIGDAAAAAWTTWASTGFSRMTGAAVVFRRGGGEGILKDYKVYTQKAWQARGQHVEMWMDKEFPRIVAAIKGEDAARWPIPRVAIYTHFSPCRECIEILKGFPGKYRDKGIEWKLGFAVWYYEGNSEVKTKYNSGIWPDEMAAKNAVRELMGLGWVVKLFQTRPGRKPIKNKEESKRLAQEAENERLIEGIDWDAWLSSIHEVPPVLVPEGSPPGL